MLSNVTENISDITSANISKIHTLSTLCNGKYFNNKTLIIIFTINSNVCDIADLYAFLTALK